MTKRTKVIPIALAGIALVVGAYQVVRFRPSDVDRQQSERTLEDPLARTTTSNSPSDTPLPGATDASPMNDDEAIRSAALRYVASTDSLMAHSPLGRREILRDLVAPDTLARLV